MTISNVLTDEFETEVWGQESIHRIIGRAMQRSDFETFKFTGDMIQNSKPLWDWSEYLVDHYVGNYELMVKFRTLQRTGVQLSKNQLAVALNSMLNTWKRSLKEGKQRIAAQVTQRLNEDVFGQPVEFEKIPDASPINLEKNQVTLQSFEGFQAPQSGTYTFVDGSGEYRVLKFDEYMGSTFISYQNGSDNESSFAKFGKITPEHKLVIWASAFHKQEKIRISNTQRAQLRDAVEFICGMDQDAHLKFGEAYAMRSGRCFMCGRTLTVPSSISAGLGPICAEKWGA